MNKKNEILDLLCEEFGSQWNPYTFLEISAKFAEIGSNNRSKMLYLAEEIEKEITNNLDKISRLGETNTEIRSRIEQNKALIEKTAEIEAKHAILIEQQNQLQELHRKEQKLRDSQSFIDSFSENLKQINGNIDATTADFQKKMTDVQNLLSDSDLENKFKNTINSIQSNLEKVKQENIDSCLTELSNIETCFVKIDNEINVKIEEYNIKREQINAVNEAFSNVSEKLKAMQEAYKTHIESDKEIVDNIKKTGDGWAFDIENKIKTNFSELDKLLENIEKEIRKKITDREKMSLDYICKKLKSLERQGNTIIEK